MYLLRPRVPPAAQRGESEGSYLASSADLMIGLLFVFILLAVVLAIEQRAAREAAVQAGKAQGAGQDPRGVVIGRLGNAIKSAVKGNVEIDAASGRLSLPEALLFDVSGRDLNPEKRARLQTATPDIIASLRCYVHSERLNGTCTENPEGHEIETIFVEGHTDSRPYSGVGYDNWNLSLDRARSVFNALVAESGLAEFRNMQGQPVFSFSAYADTRPLDIENGFSDRNRRVDLRIVLEYRPPVEKVDIAVLPKP
jgi:chemotaxis protein MotB